MKTELTRGLLLVAIVATVFAGCETRSRKPRTKQGAEAKWLSNGMRATLRTLYAWPTSTAIKKYRVDVFPNRKRCTGVFNLWLHKTIAPSWLPPKDAEPLFLKAQAGGRDVIRLRYLANGYDVQVSQTAGCFGIRLTPEDGQSTGNDDNEKLDTAKALCLRIFVETGTRWNPQSQGPQYLPITGLPKKIASASFRKDTCQRIQGDETILFGRPRTAQEEGVKMDPHAREKPGVDWFDTRTAWGYWCRQVYWWNDGKSVGIHFAKDECGQFGPGGGFGVGDEDWFTASGAGKRPRGKE